MLRAPAPPAPATSSSKTFSTAGVVIGGIILASLPAALACTYYTQSQKKPSAEPDWLMMGFGAMWLFLMPVAAYCLTVCVMASHYKTYVSATAPQLCSPLTLPQYQQAATAVSVTAA